MTTYKKQLKDKDGNTIYPDVGIDLDNVVYSDDPTTPIGDMVNPFDYSTTETRIGTWINGKPLYRKTIDCGPLPNNDVKNVSTGLSDVVYRNLYGMAITSSGTAFPLNTVRPNGSNLTGSIGAYIYGNTVTLETGADRSGYYAYATIEYTKNSD